MKRLLRYRTRKDRSFSTTRKVVSRKTSGKKNIIFKPTLRPQNPKIFKRFLSLSPLIRIPLVRDVFITVFFFFFSAFGRRYVCVHRPRQRLHVSISSGYDVRQLQYIVTTRNVNRSIACATRALLNESAEKFFHLKNKIRELVWKYYAF